MWEIEAWSVEGNKILQMYKIKVCRREREFIPIGPITLEINLPGSEVVSLQMDKRNAKHLIEDLLETI